MTEWQHWKHWNGGKRGERGERGTHARTITKGLCVALLFGGLAAASSTVVRGGQETTLPDDETMEPERELADLRYEIGVRVMFSYDEGSGEYGMEQEGTIDRTGPLVHRDVDSLLAVYLAITPKDVPVPELLLSEGSPEDAAEARATRTITAARVSATDLDLPVGTVPPVAASQSCYDTYYDWWDWHDPAVAGMVPKAYSASMFGGKRRYSDSYVANCTPAGSPGWLWAHHRIYYKNAFGNYKKHYDKKVAPWTWNAKHKGSIKRYRKVLYDDGWNSLPACGGGITCKYTREGRFHN
jgi:hypothetical protein